MITDNVNCAKTETTATQDNETATTVNHEELQYFGFDQENYGRR